jgi:hypothetical protein
MYASNTHHIRLATDADAESLSRLADLTSQRPLAGRVLIAQVDGKTVAAVSVDDGRTMADPGCFIGYLLPCLRARAQALIAYETEPSLPARMIAAIPESYRPRVTKQTEPVSTREPARRTAGADHRRRRVRAGALTRRGAASLPGRS